MKTVDSFVFTSSTEFSVKSALLKRSSQSNTPWAKQRRLTHRKKNKLWGKSATVLVNEILPAVYSSRQAKQQHLRSVFLHKHPPEHLTLKCLLCWSIWTRERRSRSSRLAADSHGWSAHLQIYSSFPCKSSSRASKLCDGPQLHRNAKWAEIQASVWCWR